MRQILNYKKLSLTLFLGLCLLALATIAQATAPTIEVPLPNISSGGQAASDPGTYIKYLFVFGLSLAGFLAVLMIILGGIQYMAAGTSLTSVQKGKAYITGALLGIALLLCSYLILDTIGGTNLTNLSPSIPTQSKINDPGANAVNCQPTSCKTGYHWVNCGCEPDTSLN